MSDMTDTSRSAEARRLQALRERLDRAEHAGAAAPAGAGAATDAAPSEAGPVDGVLISDANNRRYLSGFTGSAGHLLITRGAAVLLTDFRYVEQAGLQAPGFEAVKIDGAAWPPLAEQVKSLGVRRLGFEAEDLTVDSYLRLQQALAEAAPEAHLVPLRGLVEGLRQTKDSAEVELVRRAVAVADRAFEAVARSLVPGATERQVAWQLEVAMRERGAEAVAFPIIVAAGPHAAMPHHRPSDRPIGVGEPVVIDMGCRLDGYCSDLTRTITLGEPDARFWEIYGVVLKAQQACEDGLKAGMLGEAGDRLARNVITAAGHGEHFGHGTGHGVGLAIHEGPYLSPTRGHMEVRTGAVVTVEPGIYLPGWGGVRLEDMVVVGPARALVLTTAHKFPIVTNAAAVT